MSDFGAVEDVAPLRDARNMAANSVAVNRLTTANLDSAHWASHTQTASHTTWFTWRRICAASTWSG